MKVVARGLLRAVDVALPRRSERSFFKSTGSTFLVLDCEAALGFSFVNTALYQAIKTSNKCSKLVVGCAPLALDGLSANPFIDCLLDLGQLDSAFFPALFRLLSWRLSHSRPDVALVNCSKETFSIDGLILASGAGYRVGSGLTSVYDRMPAVSPELSSLENAMARLNPLGIDNVVGEPRIYFNSKDLAKAKALMQQCSQWRIAYVTQTSGGHPNAWWDDRFAVVADAIAGMTGAPAIFLGTKGDQTAIETIQAQMKSQSISLAGHTSVRELAAFVSQCDLVVSLDTGTLHVATGAGTPTVVIAPAHQPAHEWLPIRRKNAKVLRRDDIFCRECRLFYCPTRDCMDLIGSDEVIAAVKEIIGAGGPDIAGRDSRIASSLSHEGPEII